MTPEEKSAILAAQRRCNETFDLIQSLEADGLPPDHEAINILAEVLFERARQYYVLLDDELARRGWITFDKFNFN